MVAAGKDASRMADAALHSMEHRFGLSPRPPAQHGAGSPGTARGMQWQPQPTPAKLREKHSEDTTPHMDLSTAAGVPLPGLQLLTPGLQDRCFVILAQP